MKCPKCRTENPAGSKYCLECATPLSADRPGIEAGSMTATLRTPLRELAPGTTFAGRYQIIEEIGKGGMGRVYKALDTKIREKIALKVINAEIAMDDEARERFG